MNDSADLLIGRCSFWPEARDPEAWLRALDLLSRAEASGEIRWSSPRGLANTTLRGHLSRRAVPGLCGLDRTVEAALILGVGLLEWDDTLVTWKLSVAARELLAIRESADHRTALERLAGLVLRRSVWLRMALLKLQSGAWQLSGWDRLKASNAQLKVGTSLILDDPDPTGWLSGIEGSVLGGWTTEVSDSSPARVQIHVPKTLHPDDGLSLSPLKSPLYLLDTLGWLEPDGRLKLPTTLRRDPILAELLGPAISAAAILAEAEAAYRDDRGVFPLEPVLLRFARELGVFAESAPRDPAFIEWSDRLLADSIREGVIELFSAEPGQSRHGRGLLGNPQQKLIRWRVHEGFDALCQRLSLSYSEPEPALFS